MLHRQDSDFLMELPMHGDATDPMLVRQRPSFGITAAGLAAIGLPTVPDDAQRLWSHDLHPRIAFQLEYAAVLRAIVEQGSGK